VASVALVAQSASASFDIQRAFFLDGFSGLFLPPAVNTRRLLPPEKKAERGCKTISFPLTPDSDNPVAQSLDFGRRLFFLPARQ